MHESEEHAALVELLRMHPELVLSLVARRGVELPPGCRCRVVDPVNRQANRAADAVFVVADADGVDRLVLIIEVQRAIKARKRRTWGAYTWLEAERWDCESRVVVVTTSPDVAAWARPPLRNGPSVTHLRVVGPDDVPRITDAAEARADPPLAVLSAAMHGHGADGLPVARAAITALFELSQAVTQRYSYLVTNHLNNSTLRSICEEIMEERGIQVEESERRGPTWDECIEVMREVALAWAERKAKATMLLRQVERRGFAVDDETRARVLKCRDDELLDVWADRVLFASSAAEVFAP